MQVVPHVVRTLNSGLFTTLREEMQADHTSLLLHSGVRWLPRGKVLIRLSELKKQYHTFAGLYQHFLDKKWLLVYHIYEIYLISSTD